METIISERIPGNHRVIKKMLVLIPYLPEGTPITVDGNSYIVHNYAVEIDGGVITAHILVK